MHNSGECSLLRRNCWKLLGTVEIIENVLDLGLACNVFCLVRSVCIPFWQKQRNRWHSVRRRWCNRWVWQKRLKLVQDWRRLLLGNNLLDVTMLLHVVLMADRRSFIRWAKAKAVALFGAHREASSGLLGRANLRRGWKKQRVKWVELRREVQRFQNLTLQKLIWVDRCTVAASRYGSIQPKSDLEHHPRCTRRTCRRVDHTLHGRGKNPVIVWFRVLIVGHAVVTVIVQIPCVFSSERYAFRCAIHWKYLFLSKKHPFGASPRSCEAEILGDRVATQCEVWKSWQQLFAFWDRQEWQLWQKGGFVFVALLSSSRPAQRIRMAATKWIRMHNKQQTGHSQYMNKVHIILNVLERRSRNAMIPAAISLESTVVCKTKRRAKNLYSNSISCPSLLAAYISGWRCENVRHKVEWTNELDFLPFWRWTRRILERAIGWHVPERTAKAQNLETDSLLSLHGALCQDISDVSHQSESDPIQMVSGLEFRLSTSFDLCDTLCHSRHFTKTKQERSRKKYSWPVATAPMLQTWETWFLQVVMRHVPDACKITDIGWAAFYAAE